MDDVLNLERRVEQLQAEVERLQDELERTRSALRGCSRQNERVFAELKQYRSRVTTGGPPAPFTEDWERGESSRPPTALPEDEVVQLPAIDETAHPYGNPYNCPCPNEAPPPAVDHDHGPPDR